MKTEQEILARIQELEKQNQLLTIQDEKIVDQKEINQEDMGTMLENQKRIKINQTILEVLQWVVG